MSQLESDIVLNAPDKGARRTRLREFQSQLVERMQAARSGAKEDVTQLGVMVGQNHLLLSLKEAGEIVSVGSITEVPLTQDWFLGLTNIRGNLISVIDLSRFQGMAPTPIDKESRIIAFASGLSFNCGLLVSRVMGLRNISEMQPQSGNDPSSSPWLSQKYVDRESCTWTELNLSLIVQDQKFLHVGL